MYFVFHSNWNLSKSIIRHRYGGTSFIENLKKYKHRTSGLANILAIITEIPNFGDYISLS